MIRRAAFAALLAVLITACGGDATAPQVSDARIGEPTGPNAAMYFVVSAAEADRLIGASTEVATSVQIHESVMNDDGTMGMSHVDGLDVSPDDLLVLEPGGFHLMLVDVDRLEQGTTVQVVLEWAESGEMTVEADVVDPGATAG